MFPYIIKSIPNLFSMGNLLGGIFSITFAMNEYYRTASLLILLSAFLDLLDGRIARRLNINNRVGVELDSLADVVSFGVAPALLLHAMSQPSWISTLAFIMYPTMGALRLARFNANPTIGYYIGLPITFAGFIMALMGLFLYSNPYIAILLAGLMVSPFRIKKI